MIVVLFWTLLSFFLDDVVLGIKFLFLVGYAIFVVVYDFWRTFRDSCIFNDGRNLMDTLIFSDQRYLSWDSLFV